MGFTESLWDELIESLPDSLCCWAAEDLFRRPVENDDPLTAIDRDDGVHRGTDDAEQTFLAIPKYLVGSLVLRNIHHRAFDHGRLTLAVCG